MTSAELRSLVVGCACTALGLLLLAAGAWRGSHPGAADLGRLLSSGALTLGGIASLVAGYRWLAAGLDRPGRPWREHDGSPDL